MATVPLPAPANLVVFSGSAHPTLAECLARELGVQLGRAVVDRFPDGEIHVAIGEDVRGLDVWLVEPLSPPVGEHLLELLLLADACHRGGAARVSAVIPYLGYARHDRRCREGEPLGARVVADQLGLGAFRHLLAVDLHSVALEGFFATPLEHLTAVPLLVQAVRAHVPEPAVLVSPDLGAVRLADAFARRLKLPVAIVHKRRVSGTEVEVHGVAGPVRDLAPVIVDDMISTGGTVAAASEAILAEGARPEITVVATHGLLVGGAIERLAAIPIRRLVTTDTLPVPTGLPFEHQVVELSPLLGEAIHRIRLGRSLAELVAGR